MYIRKLAAAAGFATGAALAFAPFASADSSSDSASLIDSLISGVSPAAGVTDFQISFNGTDLFSTVGNEATATTVAGQYGLAIAYGDGASATAEGGTGDYALASGTDALAKAGSTATGATGFNYDTAEDIGNNPADGTFDGAPDGAYAGGGSLIGGVDSATASSHDSAYDIGSNSVDTSGTPDGGNSGAFAGDGQLIGLSGSGSGDTAYTNGDLSGFGDGSAAVDGNNDFASSTGTETGTNEGSFAGVGNNNTAIADTNYTDSDDGVSATAGNGNYAYVYGPDNSTADAGGTSTELANNNIAYVTDPFASATSTADSAVAGSTTSAAGGSDLAEVLYTQGDASATGAPNLYDIITPFGTSATPAAATAAADAAAPTEITTTVSSEVASANSTFQLDALLAGVPSTDYSVGAQGFDVINPADVATVQGTGTTTFDYLIYGADPTQAGLSSDPGAYDVFNGAEVKFDDAYNVAVYALENNGALDPTATDFFGSLPSGFANDTAAQAFESFYNSGIGDLSGFFQTDLSGLDISAATATSLFDLFDPSAAASLF